MYGSGDRSWKQVPVGDARVAAAPGLSAVVPCYNEDDGLAELERRLSAACRAVCGDDYEIVLVNDGSRDATWRVIRSLAEADSHIAGVDLSRNYGHQLALTAGLSVCRGRRVLVIDADLQDPPELLGDMMALMDRGADVVYGQRRSRAGEGWFKRVTAALFYRMLRHLTDIDIPVDAGDFRLMSRRALEALQSMPESHRFIRGMVSWIGFHQVPLVYDRAERFAGQTKYPFRKMARFAIDAITGFSTRPLRLASYAGLALAAFGLLMLGYALHEWWLGDVIAGWTSVMSAVLLLGSVQMLFLGIFGEYLGRLYVEAKRRPLFIVRDVVRAPRGARTTAAGRAKVPAD
jgi:dolichol-phosphate mannosyltransferase